MTRRITSIQPLLEKARACKVVHVRGNIYRVTSPTSNERYWVNLRDYSCTDPRQEYIGEENNYINACSHVQAALIYRELHEGYWLVARAEDEDVRHYHQKLYPMHRMGNEIAGGDGVIFTGRRIPPGRARRHIERMNGELWPA
jgi:hypothetical protein